jgi:histidinol-phosphate aminotransferase
MSLPFKSHIAKLPAYTPPAVPPGVTRAVDLSSNENPLGPSPLAVAALREAVETVNRYPDASGTALKEALARRWDLSPSNVALSNGADEWVLLLCVSLVEPGDEVVMAQGSFISYLLRATEVGARVIRVPLKDYTHDLEAMAQAITDRTRLVFVCNPNNPTGTMVDGAAMDRFLEQVPDRVPVVVDEAYYEYVADPGQMRALEHVRAGRQNLIVLRSFSKVYGLAGLRVGYMLSSEVMIDYVERARPPFNVNRLAQAAALAALGDEEHVRRSVEANQAAKDTFCRELPLLGLHPIPTHANFMAVDVGRPGAQVSGPLLERGFITTATDAWGVPDHVRFSFGTPQENQAFLSALRDILRDER